MPYVKCRIHAHTQTLTHANTGNVKFEKSNDSWIELLLFGIFNAFMCDFSECAWIHEWFTSFNSFYRTKKQFSCLAFITAAMRISHWSHLHNIKAPVLPIVAEIVRTKAKIKYAYKQSVADSSGLILVWSGSICFGLVWFCFVLFAAPIAILFQAAHRKSQIYSEHFEHCLYMKQQTKEQMNHTNEAIFTAQMNTIFFYGFWIAKDLLRALADMMSASLLCVRLLSNRSGFGLFFFSFSVSISHFRRCAF